MLLLLMRNGDMMPYLSNTEACKWVGGGDLYGEQRHDALLVEYRNLEAVLAEKCSLTGLRRRAGYGNNRHARM